MRFYGYFKEHVVESRLENAKVRKVTIFYYLEDKSIMVTEPKQVNSGTPQGAFLKRQVVLKPDGCPFMPDDFSIGCDTGIFGRQVRIYDCDDYTREFYNVSYTLFLAFLRTLALEHHFASLEPLLQHLDYSDTPFWEACSALRRRFIDLATFLMP